MKELSISLSKLRAFCKEQKVGWEEMMEVLNGHATQHNGAPHYSLDHCQAAVKKILAAKALHPDVPLKLLGLEPLTPEEMGNPGAYVPTSLKPVIREFPALVDDPLPNFSPGLKKAKCPTCNRPFDKKEGNHDGSGIGNGTSGSGLQKPEVKAN
jgi:hypothetical protein